MLRESTARVDVRYTSAASCSVCCTENSFPQLRPAPRTAPPGLAKFSNFERFAQRHLGATGALMPPCVALNLTEHVASDPLLRRVPRPAPTVARIVTAAPPEWILVGIRRIFAWRRRTLSFSPYCITSGCTLHRWIILDTFSAADSRAETSHECNNDVSTSLPIRCFLVIGSIDIVLTLCF